ncbi:hypothetical protein PCLA_10r0232 [Pseudomonas citronellolis]|nr:hypothetical protein PCLA_10r0232 [Pseudomonas citronellolis]
MSLAHRCSVCRCCRFGWRCYRRAGSAGHRPPGLGRPPRPFRRCRSRPGLQNPQEASAATHLLPAAT